MTPLSNLIAAAYAEAAIHGECSCGLCRAVRLYEANERMNERHEEVFQRSVVWTVSPADFAKIEEAIKRPPNPTPALVELMKGWAEGDDS